MPQRSIAAGLILTNMEDNNMSAFVVTKKHIAALVRFYQVRQRGHFDGNDALTWMNRLMRKNIESVRYLYGGSIRKLPGYIPELAEIDKLSEDEGIFTILDLFNAPRIQPVQALKAILCLDYQSCELPDWYQSEECQFLQRVLRVAIGALAGYEDADWEIT